MTKELWQDPFQLMVPLALLIGTLLAGLIVRRVLFGVLGRWAAHSRSQLDVLITESLKGPIILWALILGVHLATQNSRIPKPYLHYVPTTLQVLWILSLTIAMSHLAGSAVRFYGNRFAGVQDVTSLTQKLAQVFVVSLGLAWLLRVVFDLNPSTILTTLGVGGLAVALALQDTLSNLFAGFYVSVSGLVRIGDYIKLSTGEEGYITDITWRCTMMRGTTNNLVVIPNNKLGQAIYTNYNLPDTRLGMSLSFAVGYESDIDRVEAILLEEVNSAAGHVDGLVADPAPNIRFIPGPGDWSLQFQVNFSVAQFADQSLVQSELRKRIFKRLKREGISMPFPTRTIVLEEKTQA
ncbi:MAG TPA: mechanosensitive ion channel family protein [Bryobacteraceae bacterium]|jgi:small-conductance mechanosensitive channel|nr:mechanosensitive ion channel family protein [Bryobacteraceae bacterium]